MVACLNSCFSASALGARFDDKSLVVTANVCASWCGIGRRGRMFHGGVLAFVVLGGFMGSACLLSGSRTGQVALCLVPIVSSMPPPSCVFACWLQMLLTGNRA